MTELKVHAAVMKYGDLSGLDVNESREDAERAAREIDQCPSFLLGRFQRMRYYQQIGEADLAKREMQALLQLGWGGRWVEAVNLYRKKDLVRAEQILKQVRHAVAGWCAALFGNSREFLRKIGSIAGVYPHGPREYASPRSVSSAFYSK